MRYDTTIVSNIRFPFSMLLQVRSGYHVGLDRLKETLFTLPEYLREIGKVRLMTITDSLESCS